MAVTRILGALHADEYIGLSAGDGSGNGDEATTGVTYYLNNSTTVLADGAIGGSNGNDGLSPKTPFLTLTYAVSRCVSGRGDKIVPMPPHAETLTAVLTINVDNLT